MKQGSILASLYVSSIFNVKNSNTNPTNIMGYLEGPTRGDLKVL